MVNAHAARIRSFSLRRSWRRLLEGLPSLQHDPNRPEDVLKVDEDEDGNGGDDAASITRRMDSFRIAEHCRIAVSTLRAVSLLEIIVGGFELTSRTFSVNSED